MANRRELDIRSDARIGTGETFDDPQVDRFENNVFFFSLFRHYVTVRWIELFSTLLFQNISI